MADLFSLAAAEEAQGRRRQMLRTAFGPTIAAALADPTVIEVIVNPDGKLWIERATLGRQDTGERIGSAEAERIIRLVAAHVRREVHDKAPIVSAELPESGERFEGVMPPLSPAPCFAVRKPAEVLYRLARLCGGTHHDGAPGAGAGTQRTRAQEHPRGRRHLVGQDHARQRPAGRNRRAQRARRHPGGHTRTQVRRGRLCFPAHQAGRGDARGSRALDAETASRSDHHRRGARAGSPRHAEGLEHRSSRRRHHRARQLRHGTASIGSSNWCRRRW